MSDTFKIKQNSITHRTKTQIQRKNKQNPKNNKNEKN